MYFGHVLDICLRFYYLFVFLLFRHVLSVFGRIFGICTRFPSSVAILGICSCCTYGSCFWYSVVFFVFDGV